jgi:hypothetical protein
MNYCNMQWRLFHGNMGLPLYSVLQYYYIVKYSMDINNEKLVSIIYQ